jgi:hypothetical protein
MAQHPTNKPTILYQPLLAQVLWLNSMRGKKLAMYHATHKQTNKQTHILFLRHRCQNEFVVLTTT